MKICFLQSFGVITFQKSGWTQHVLFTVQDCLSPSSCCEWAFVPAGDAVNLRTKPHWRGREVGYHFNVAFENKGAKSCWHFRNVLWNEQMWQKIDLFSSFNSRHWPTGLHFGGLHCWITVPSMKFFLFWRSVQDVKCGTDTVEELENEGAAAKKRNSLASKLL